MVKRRPKTREKPKKGSAVRQQRPFFPIILAFATGCVVCCGLFLLSASKKSGSISQRPTFGQLLNMSENELATVDIALMNLLCAEGLDGSEDLDVERCLETLDKWADICREDIQKRLTGPVFLMVVNEDVGMECIC